MDFNAYIADFNRGDFGPLVARWYTPDASFQSGKVNARGPEEIRDLLHFVYGGVRTTLRPQTVLAGGEHLFAEIDAEHEALEDRPDTPLGALRVGDVMRMKFFCLLKTREGRICEFRVAEWPANIGVGVAGTTT